jgi:hypothetical protein
MTMDTDRRQDDALHDDAAAPRDDGTTPELHPEERAEIAARVAGEVDAGDAPDDRTGDDQPRDDGTDDGPGAGDDTAGRRRGMGNSIALFLEDPVVFRSASFLLLLSALVIWGLVGFNYWR